MDNKLLHLLAFTLAEVLIVIAIIGMIADMTIPTLMAGYRKIYYVTALKKTYSDLNQAFKLMMVNDGVTDFKDTNFARAIDMNSFYYSANTTSLNVKKVNSELAKVFKGATFDKEGVAVAETFYKKDLKSNVNVNTKYRRMYLPSGVIIGLDIYPYESETTAQAVKACGGKMFEMYGLVSIDINGFKNPNRLGRDVFMYLLSSKGELFPTGGKDEVCYYGDSIEDSVDYWENTDSCGAIGTDVLTNTATGAYCAARIMQENWQMNY